MKGLATLDWFEQIADESILNRLSSDENGDSWLILEEIEKILRDLTRLHRQTGQLSHETYEDFADKLQSMVDNLRTCLGHCDGDIDEQDENGQLELALDK